MFVQINERILDKEQYERELLLLKVIVEKELSEILDKYDFKRKGRTFVNEELLLKCTISFKKEQTLKTV